MSNHFGIDTEDVSITEYFEPFIFGEWFNYPDFIERVIKLHVPEALNEKLLPFYCVMNEISNILILTENQSFHDFKNKLSNTLFNRDNPNIINYS